MCGVAGIIDHGTMAGDDIPTRVRQMCDLQRYRGPDDIGVQQLGRVCLGSIRLSILDLSAAGHMPMFDASGKWCIAYNGEVYNFREIREELVALGYSFASQTDTEVVLNAFIEWREACLEKLVGMFAFAICDRDTETVYLVRDRYGIKPMYYVDEAHELRFGSEIKALISGRRDFRIDKQSLIEWSLYRNVDVMNPRTLLEGVRSVLPGEIVTVRGREIEHQRYYRLTGHVDAAKFRQNGSDQQSDVVAGIRETLDRAVEQRLISDVPVGTLCSGGLDSSLVTAIAAGHSRDLTVFNVAIAGHEDLDESRYARRISEHFGLKFVSFPLTPEVFRQELTRVIYQTDLPLTHPNTVAYHLICRVARQHNVPVLLSGEGADELFGGYDHYRKFRTMLLLDRLLKRLPRSVQSKLPSLGLALLGMQRTSMHVRDLLPLSIQFVDDFARRSWTHECESAYAFVEDPVDRALLGAILSDLGDFLTPLLRRLDRTSMVNSIECRVPFLDHRLVHQAINLPLSYRLGKKTNKWILRKIAEDYLPADIWQRRKAGFPLPLTEYLGPLATMEIFHDGFCENELGFPAYELKGIVENFSDRLQVFFSILSLEIWGRLYLRGQSVEEVSSFVATATGDARSGGQQDSMIQLA